MLLWILRRELARQTRYRERPSGGRYEGPLRPLLLVAGSAGLLTLLDAPPEIAGSAALALYVLYLACAAARLGAGALVGDLDTFRLAQASPLEVLGGKLVAVLLPFAGELAVGAAALRLARPAAPTEAIVGILAGVALTYASLGLCRSVCCSDVEDAVRSAARWVQVIMWGAPTLSMTLEAFSSSSSPPAPVLAPCLLHPCLGLLELQCRLASDPGTHVFALMHSLAAVAPLCFFLAALVRLRRRLA